MVKPKTTLRHTGFSSRARAASFRVGGGGGEGLERQTSKDESIGGVRGVLPRKFFILTPLKCREMHSKLINEILKCKLSVLKKRYFYPVDIDKHLFSPIIKGLCNNYQEGGSKTRGGAQCKLTALGRGVTCKFLGKWGGGGATEKLTLRLNYQRRIFH